MALIRITPKPGVNSQLTQAANTDGHYQANLIRYRFGLTERLAGWQRISLHNNAATTALGYIRALHDWLDLSNNKELMLGTDGGPQVIVNDTLYNMDIVAGTSTALVTFSVNSGSATVTVNIPDEVVVVAGDTFTLLMPVSIGRRILAVDSTFTIATAAVGSFTFTMSQSATLTQTNVEGIPEFDISWDLAESQLTGQINFIRHGVSGGGTFTVDQTTQVTSAGGNLLIPAGTEITATSVTLDVINFDPTPYVSGLVGQSSISVFEGTTTDSDGNPVFGDLLSFLVTTTTLGGVSNQWFAANFGEVGLMVYTRSPLLSYQPSGTQPPLGSTPRLAIVGGGDPATAPQLNNGMFVAMPQAQVILWGTEATMGEGTVDPLLLRFSDAGDFETYTATVSNQAGSFRLSRGSQIVGGIQAPQATLILTDTDCWQMSYIGPPLVYGFTIMGAECGLAAPHAIVSLGRNTYWQGQNSFWFFGDGGVRPMPCTVYDYIFNDLDTENVNKCHAGSSADTNEIYFFFPSLTDKPEVPDNLLQFSEQFDQTAGWGATGIGSFTDGFSAPDGTTSAQRLVENTSASSYHSVSQTISKDSENVQYTFSLYVHKDSTRNFAIEAAGVSGSVIAFFNPTTGATGYNAATGSDVTLDSVGSTTDAMATGIAGNGWLRYFVTFTSDATATLTLTIYNASATTTGSNLYSGNGGSGAIIWGAQLNYDTLGDYEPIALYSTNECTRYVKYNVVENLWDTGQWPQGQIRTAWTECSWLGVPIGGDSNFRIQQHETGYDDDGEPMEGAFLETGYGTMQDGNQIMFVDECEPDLKWFGNDGAVNLILKTAQYPGSAPVSFGPYSMTPTTRFFSLRMRSKLIALRYEWAPITGYSARIGGMAFRVKPAGSRP